MENYRIYREDTHNYLKFLENVKKYSKLIKIINITQKYSKLIKNYN